MEKQGSHFVAGASDGKNVASTDSSSDCREGSITGYRCDVADGGAANLTYTKSKYNAANENVTVGKSPNLPPTRTFPACVARALTVPLNGEGDDGLQSRAEDHSRVRMFHLAKEPL